MKLLAIDASAGAASACVWEEGKVLGENYTNTHLTHSQTLMPMIDGVLQYARIPLSEIDAFAVSAGPGSFTGVRIAVSSIKGIAMATGKPCVSVSTLEAMAQNLLVLPCTACCVMDARCGQVYNALFSIEDGKVRRLCEDRALSIKELAEECAGLSEPLILVGDGAQLCAKSPEFMEINACLSPEPIQYQRASGVARVAAEKFLRGETVTARELQPIYLRSPQAERSLRLKNKKV